jgi:hypothetical protein
LCFYPHTQETKQRIATLNLLQNKQECINVLMMKALDFSNPVKCASEVSCSNCTHHAKRRRDTISHARNEQQRRTNNGSSSVSSTSSSSSYTSSSQTANCNLEAFCDDVGEKLAKNQHEFSSACMQCVFFRRIDCGYKLSSGSGCSYPGARLCYSCFAEQTNGDFHSSAHCIWKINSTFNIDESTGTLIQRQGLCSFCCGRAHANCQNKDVVKPMMMLLLASPLDEWLTDLCEASVDNIALQAPLEVSPNVSDTEKRKQVFRWLHRMDKMNRFSHFQHVFVMLVNR